MKIEFFIPMILPTVTHQEKKISVKNGKQVHYEPPELKDARAKFSAYFAKYVPDKKFTSAVKLETVWCYPLTGKHTEGEYKITKPDTDNIVKLPKDVFTALGFWADDALVADEHIVKIWSARPGVYVRMEDKDG